MGALSAGVPLRDMLMPFSLMGFDTLLTCKPNLDHYTIYILWAKGITGLVCLKQNLYLDSLKAVTTETSTRLPMQRVPKQASCFTGF
ncbi:hypothetical protein AWH49_04575 [Domibacillus aminovorans]|uniref:Uncharacterized protein n=1 Tax=Domibacillus aminovorans TaxID=29332 RepID=A0A177L114_9BACI|nr:hypothetical protein AWH49_04575 [Domibacillus aminovorans]